MDTNIGNILIYQNEKGDTKVDAYFNDDTIWMTQRSISELYQISKSSVSEHIKNIYLDRELDENSTVRKFRTVQTEGSRQVSREMDYYNLDMVLAVGYRVRSNIGIHFRTGHPLYSQNICERDLRLMMSALKKNLARIILMNYLSVFVTLEHLKNVCT